MNEIYKKHLTFLEEKRESYVKMVDSSTDILRNEVLKCGGAGKRIELMTRIVDGFYKHLEFIEEEIKKTRSIIA